MEIQIAIAFVYSKLECRFIFSISARKNPFPQRHEAMLSSRMKNPRPFLSYGVNLHGPTEKNFDIPKDAEHTDKAKVRIVFQWCRSTTISFPSNTINIIM